MNEEQKIRGGGNPELNDEALDAVTGGTRPWGGNRLSPSDAALQAIEGVYGPVGVDTELKEEQP